MISILIPIYNRSHLIIETLQSIKKQIYENWECIIVDDGSTDNTIDICNDYTSDDSRFQIFSRPSHLKKGPSSCRNFAFSKALGDYIQFFDSDDVMHPEHLLKKRNAIDTADFVVCKLQEFDNEFNSNLFLKDKTPDIEYSENVFEDFVSGVFPMMMVAPLWKKSVLKNYMPIREDLHILEDHELFARALFNKKEYKIINEPLIYYRVGAFSSTNSFYKNINYGLESYFKAKKTVLKLTDSKRVKYAILKMTLGFFRMGLAQRDFKSATYCLDFIKSENLCYNLNLKLKCTRIHFFYIIFKVLKRGDTQFKSLFKI
ncbi:glycosyltransferase [Flavobacteriaceae bacterium AU392]|nr:glycosyltransferase [Flavobacteriaceae bacterium]RKM82820.1 glycosyltransferase [Flavobacteriaceae bacterium AU392]